MNIPSRAAFVVATMLFTVLVISPPGVWAQTPAQMEYERQQREYRQQQERQQESRRLNAPMGRSPAPSYQGGATSQTAPQQPRTRSNATAATAGAEWVAMGSHTNDGGIDIYAARSTIRRSSQLVKMWDMLDYKTAQVFERKRFLSIKMEYEYNC